MLREPGTALMVLGVEQVDAEADAGVGIGMGRVGDWEGFLPLKLKKSKISISWFLKGIDPIFKIFKIN